MENFTFHNFLGQIYQSNPELKQHDEFVRQFLKDELKGKKSFVVDEAIIAKALLYVEKRVNVTTVGEQTLSDHTMLFAKEALQTTNTLEVTPNIDETGKNEKPTKQESPKLFSMDQSVSSQSTSSISPFLLGFVLGGFVVGFMCVYNYMIAPLQGWSALW